MLTRILVGASAFIQKSGRALGMLSRRGSSSVPRFLVHSCGCASGVKLSGACDDDDEIRS